jgi:hypothetical protein
MSTEVSCRKLSCAWGDACQKHMIQRVSAIACDFAFNGCMDVTHQPCTGRTLFGSASSKHVHSAGVWHLDGTSV